jgi:zinc/manganese transport system substrate-binding protein
MKKFLTIFFFFFAANSANAKVAIFSCEPEWTSLIKEIAGNQVDVFTATGNFENPSFFKPTTNVINIVRKVDMVFCTGGNLESAWLPDLIAASENPKIQSGANTIYAINFAAKNLPGEEKIENPALKVNPRPHLNPRNILKISAEFLRQIKALDPANADFYQQSYRNFYQKWNKAMEVWAEKSQPLKGMTVVVRDDSWLELTNWLGLKIVARTDFGGAAIKGVELRNLASELSKNPPQLILFAFFENKNPAIFLGRMLRVKTLQLPFTIGKIGSNSQNLFQLYDNTIVLLLNECSELKCPATSANLE